MTQFSLELTRAIREKSKSGDGKAWRLSSNTPAECEPVWQPVLPGGHHHRNLLHSCFILQTLSGTSEPNQQGGFHYWVLHCGFLPSHDMWSNILIFEIVYFLSLKAKISCKIQTRLTARLIKFRTFRPSCKIKSMPVAAFHNMFTSWLCDAIKMLHLQVILLAFAFMLWLKGLALKST